MYLIPGLKSCTILLNTYAGPFRLYPKVTSDWVNTKHLVQKEAVLTGWVSKEFQRHNIRYIGYIITVVTHQPVVSDLGQRMLNTGGVSNAMPLFNIIVSLWIKGQKSD